MTIPQIPEGNHGAQRQHTTPTPVVWYPPTRSSQSSQTTSTTYAQPTASQPATSSQSSPQHTRTSSENATQEHSEVSRSTQSEPHSSDADASQETASPKETSQATATSASPIPTGEEHKPAASDAQRTMPTHDAKRASQPAASETSASEATSTAERKGKSKWLKRTASSSPEKQVQASQTNRDTPSHFAAQQLGQRITEAARAEARSTGQSATPESRAGDVHGSSHAQENAQSIAYETFAGKSDMAIVRASHALQYHVYTVSSVQSVMRVTYTSNRRGQIETLHVDTSSGDKAIDTAIVKIIQSADLPPIPPEHTHDTITRTVTIQIRKAPGRDPVILYIART